LSPTRTDGGRVKRRVSDLIIERHFEPDPDRMARAVVTVLGWQPRRDEAGTGGEPVPAVSETTPHVESPPRRREFSTAPPSRTPTQPIEVREADGIEPSARAEAGGNVTSPRG
jgi:hypothetical protein